MKKETLLDKVRHIIYKITLPVYLWSVGFRSLEEYINEIYRQESYFRKHGKA